MRRQLVVVSCLMAALAVGVVLASEPKGSEVKGTVKSIDAVTRTVTVETSSGSQVFKVDDSSPIATSDTGKKLEFKDLRIGEHVRVHYTGSGTQVKLSRIEVLPEQAAKLQVPQPKHK